MKEFGNYIDQILNNLEIPSKEKKELEQEFLDHLLMLKQHYVERGHPGKIAIQLSIRDFGNSSDLAPLLQKSVHPLYNWKKFILWTGFMLYIFCYFYSQFILVGKRNYTDYGQLFRSQFSYDFSILNDIHYPLVIVYISIIALSTFGPLGYFWTQLSPHSFRINLFISLAFIQAIHLICFLMKFNEFNVSILIYHLIGFTFGAVFFKLVRQLGKVPNQQSNGILE